MGIVILFFQKKLFFVLPCFGQKKQGFFTSILKIFSLILVFSYIFPSQALKIRFPDEELATESVLPIVHPMQTVLERNVPLKMRAEIGLGVAFGLDEPFYYPVYGAGLFAFHITDIHSISLTSIYFPPLLSNTGINLKQGIGLETEGKSFDAQKVPYPQMMGFINYQYTPYYGKISLTKNYIMNLSFYGYVGPGLLIFDQGVQTFAANIGIGQKLYFNKWIGIRGELGIYGYYGPSPAKIKLGADVHQILFKDLKPEQKRIINHIVTNIGIVFLI